MANGTGMGRALLIGALSGVAIVIVLVLGVVFRLDRYLGMENVQPENVLLACISEDDEGGAVAGVVFVMNADGRVEPVDSSMSVTISGTSYNRLRDAYSFGGGAALAKTYEDASGVDVSSWVVLPAKVWMDVVDRAGGVEVTLPSEANIFVEDELYVFERGVNTLSGREANALIVASMDDEWGLAGDVRGAVSAGIADAVGASWSDVIDSVDAGSATSDASSEELAIFGETAGL